MLEPPERVLSLAKVCFVVAVHSMETPRRKKEQTIEVSISDRDEIAKAADIKRVITLVDSADDGGEVQRLH